jgi:hypothetical protein
VKKKNQLRSSGRVKPKARLCESWVITVDSASREAASESS